MSEDKKKRREMSLREKLTLPEASEPPWSLFSALLSYGVLFLCLTVIGTSLATLGSARQVLFSRELMLGWALGMAIAIVFILVSHRSSDESWKALRLVKGVLPLPLALLIGIAIALALDLGVSLASGEFWPVPQIWRFQSLEAMGLPLAALMLIVLQPLAETLVFQAVLLPRLRWAFGHWGGLLGASALYTVLYYLVFIEPYAFYDPFWHGIVFPAGIAIFFSLLKVYTQSTAAALLGRMGAGLVLLLTALAIYGQYNFAA